MIQQVASPIQSVSVPVFCVKLWCIKSHSWLLVTLLMYCKKCFLALVGLHHVDIASLWYHWEFVFLIVLMNTFILDVGNKYIFILYSYTHNLSRTNYKFVPSPWGSQTSSTRNHNSLTFIYCIIGWWWHNYSRDLHWAVSTVICQSVNNIWWSCLSHSPSHGSPQPVSKLILCCRDV